MYVYVVFQVNQFNKNPICFYHTEEGAQACVNRMSAKSNYTYYWEEVEIGG